MADSDKVCIDDWAFMNWHRVPEHAREDILQTLRPLADLPPEQWPKERIERWEAEENMYALPFWLGTKEFLVFFYPQDQHIHIESLFRRDLFKQRGHQAQEAKCKEQVQKRVTRSR